MPSPSPTRPPVVVALTVAVSFALGLGLLGAVGCAFHGANEGQALCASDADCSDGAPCVEGLCGAPGSGPLLPPSPAGDDCRSQERACQDTRDDDCDGLIDCADADCADACLEGSDAASTGEPSSDAGTPDAGTSPTVTMPPCSKEGDACDDENPCTGNGTCDASGGCRPGAPLADATACGPRSSDRCCAGKCRDLTVDPDHCGGCGLRCKTGVCEASAPTESVCQDPVLRSRLSGRCTCAGLTGNCPGGQICRTDSPLRHMCTPRNGGDCATGQLFTEILECPNICSYPES